MDIQEILTTMTIQKCQAKSKCTGKQCGNYAIKDKRVCKFHGGLSTGPKTEEGRQRQHMASWKHGMRSKAAIEAARQLREYIRQCRQNIR